MDLASSGIGLLATGTIDGDESVRVYSLSSDGDSYTTVPMPAQRGRPFEPSIMCQKFGPSSINANYLVAGFGSDQVRASGMLSSRGLLALWRFDEGRCTSVPICRKQRQVFDVAWSSRDNHFLAGSCSTDGTPNTVVRLYSIDHQDMTLEAWCPAADINEVSFCPFDERLCSAACTDNKVYFWDIRRADRTLHTLTHGSNVSGTTSPYEDTGVRLVQYGRGLNEVFTGASDGVLKQYDIRRHESSAFIEDVIETGVELMCGQLSPDKNEFLIGDAAGSLHVLSRSPFKTTEAPEMLGFEDESMFHTAEHGAETVEDTADQGRAAAKYLLESRQIVMHPEFGPIQGPKYKRGKNVKHEAPVLVPEIERTKKLININRKRAYEDAFGMPKKTLKLRIRKSASVMKDKAVGRPLPQPPGSPFSQFSAHLQPQIETDENGVTDQVMNKTTQEWNKLSSEDKDLWKHRYEEEMVDFSKLKKQYTRSTDICRSSLGKNDRFVASDGATCEDRSELTESALDRSPRVSSVQRVGSEKAEELLSDEEESDHYFPAAWQVDANIQQRRAET